jgi:hypothetical protein
MGNLKFRAKCAFDQLLRYGDTLFTEELADLLDEIAEINDDMNHARDPREAIQRSRTILDTIEKQKWTVI